MSERAELLFKKLRNRKAIHALVGQSEGADFDCKEWHGADMTKASIAKAVCGFANATGGVIVGGMSAKGTGANLTTREPGVHQTIQMVPVLSTEKMGIFRNRLRLRNLM